ncbi:SLC13 family permease [Thermococcus sp.]|uniref:SLC13 family permease n=1 Tax=Thermococcus sp. TaxID=35749 RepID=UPI00262932F1|nr:SLC13 family permease [Thermococcus sp.]
MLSLYLVLVLLNPSLLSKTPALIDWGSLSLITSLIIASKALELSGVFVRLSSRLIALSSDSERRMMLILLPVIAFTSALIMNDTAMLVFIPLVALTSELSGIDKAKAVTLSAIAANAGSALTPIGNPQNVILWQTYGISFGAFIRAMLPFVLLWLLLLLAFALSVGNRKLEVGEIPAVPLKKGALLSAFLLIIADVLLAETGRALWTFPLTFFVVLLFSREALVAFDWVLVLTFALIFIDFGEISSIVASLGLSFPHTGVSLLLASSLLSQIISNVPATVLIIGAKPEWLPLAVGVNAGGTGFIIGSLANLIAVRIAGVRIRDFHRISVPYFLAALLLSTLLLAGIEG